MHRARHRSPILLLLTLFTAASAEAGPIELLSHVPPRHISDTANGDSSVWSISADGHYVVFLSDASNLISGLVDENGWTDVYFVYGRVTGTTELVSRSVTSPLTTASSFSEEAVLSADGRFVAFVSYATDLLPGLEGGSFPVLSANGRVIAFLSDRAGIVPGQTPANNLFLYDWMSGTSQLVADLGS